MLKQFIRLPNERHAIKEATISLFFGSVFVDLPQLAETIKGALSSVFELTELLHRQQVEVRVEGPFPNPNLTTNLAEPDVTGVRASRLHDGRPHRVLQLLNEEERVSLSLHNLHYDRWDDFLTLFEEVTQSLAPRLANMVVVGCGLHYVDELAWTHPTMPLPLEQIYQANPAYLPDRFFESAASELLLTVPSTCGNVHYFDRLHVTSLSNNQPVATISHNLVHQFDEQRDLTALQKQPNALRHVLQQAHEQNKLVLRAILQPEIRFLIKLDAS